MKRVTEFLDKSNVQYLATIGLDGKPKVRPFQYMFEDAGKLWFCTSNQKAVYKELSQQPYVELCALDANKSWLRLEGKAVFSDAIQIKEKVFALSPLVAGIYKEPTNPAFEVFCLDEVTATISSIGKVAEVIGL